MLEVVLMNWLKSLVAGLARLIRALLGCGPEDDEIQWLMLLERRITALLIF